MERPTRTKKLTAKLTAKNGFIAACGVIGAMLAGPFWNMPFIESELAEVLVGGAIGGSLGYGFTKIVDRD